MLHKKIVINKNNMYKFTGDVYDILRDEMDTIINFIGFNNMHNKYIFMESNQNSSR